MRVLEPRARALLPIGGCAAMKAICGCVSTAVWSPNLLANGPSTFTLAARNPRPQSQVRRHDVVFASVGGPAYVMDNDQGQARRHLCRDVRLPETDPVAEHHPSGRRRAVRAARSARRTRGISTSTTPQITLLDKNWQTQTLGRARTMDGAGNGGDRAGARRREESGRHAGAARDHQHQLAVATRHPDGRGLIALAEHGQVNVITPFTLAGAMCAGDARRGAGAAACRGDGGHRRSTQIVRPGVPVMYGGFTSNVDMRSGAPAFGTPEYAKAAQASGQLARHIGVPFRSSNVTAANEVDAQAAYESQMSLWGAVMGGRASGGACGGLDAWRADRQLRETDHRRRNAADDGGLFRAHRGGRRRRLAVEAIRDGGPGGPFLRRGPHDDTLRDTPSMRRWCRTGTTTTMGAKRGRSMARERANAIWKQMLGEYEQPAIDPAIDDALKDYMARRKRQLTNRTDSRRSLLYSRSIS